MNSSVTKQPLISVIVPVYNIIPYLPRCVESLRTQTYENLEILLIDDGSTDETPALCDRLEAEDERIRVFHKRTAGLLPPGISDYSRPGRICGLCGQR